MKMDYKIQTRLILSSDQLFHKLQEDIILFAEEIPQETIRLCDTENGIYLAEEIANRAFQNFIIDNQEEYFPESSLEECFAEIAFMDSFELHHGGFFYHFKQNFRYIARIHGVSIAIVWGATELAQISTIFVLTSIGLPEVAALAPVFPLTWFNTAVAIQLKSIRHHRNMRRGYRSGKSKRTAAKVERNVRREYQIKNIHSIVHVFEEEHQKDSLLAVTLNRNNFLISMGSFFGLNGKKAYFRNIKKVIRKAKVKDEYIKQIYKSKEISRQMRSLLCLLYLRENEPGVFEKARLKFDNSFHKIPAKAAGKRIDSEAKEWVYKALEVTSLDEIPAILRATPHNLQVGVVMDLMNNIILPHWADYLDKTGYGNFRRMVKGINHTYYYSLQFSAQYWDDEWSERLVESTELEE